MDPAKVAEYARLVVVVEIDDEAVDERKGKSKATGDEYHIRRQTGYHHKPGYRFPQIVKISLEPTDPAYKRGFYAMDPDSMVIGDYGLEVDRRMKLVPLPASAPRAQS